MVEPAETTVELLHICCTPWIALTTLGCTNGDGAIAVGAAAAVAALALAFLCFPPPEMVAPIASMLLGVAVYRWTSDLSNQPGANSTGALKKKR